MAKKCLIVKDGDRTIYKKCGKSVDSALRNIMGTENHTLMKLQTTRSGSSGVQRRGEMTGDYHFVEAHYRRFPKKRK